MEYFVEEKPDTGLNKSIKVSSSIDAFNLKEVQMIKNAIQEHLLFIGLDKGNNVRKINLLSIGTSCYTLIDSKSIIRNAILSGSDKVILVHNHPSNSLKPSNQDQYVTIVIKKLLKTFEIELIDHIIVTEENYVSMEKLKIIDKKLENAEFKLMEQAFLTEENERLKKENEELKNQNKKLKNKEGEMMYMNKYESVIIMRPTINEEERKKELDNYREFLEGLSNSPVTIEDLGNKKLAYEIQNNKEGIYAIFNFYGKTEDISELERKYRTDENVMKFITIRHEQEFEESQNIDEEDMEMN